MSELPGIGVFGTGTAVKCLVPILKRCGFRVEALWGKTQEQAADCARDLGIEFYTTKVDQMLLLKQVDLVFISCPPLSQSPIAVKALGIGKHVICGTPTGPTQLEILRMVNAGEYYPSLMSIMCNGLRLLPCFSRMKAMLEEGVVGEVLVCEVRIHCGSLVKSSFDWLCDSTMGGGVLNVYGSLFIDLLHFLLGFQATHVNGTVRTFVTQTAKIYGFRRISSDDFCSFTMHHPNHTMATIVINSHASHHYHQEVLVCGSKGRLEVRASDLFKAAPGKEEELVYRDVPSILDNQQSGVVDCICADVPAPHMKGLFRLIDAVKEAFSGEPDKHAWSPAALSSVATFPDEHYVQAVVEAVRKSSEHRKAFKVEKVTEEPRADIFVAEAMKRNQTNCY